MRKGADPTPPMGQLKVKEGTYNAVNSAYG